MRSRNKGGRPPVLPPQGRPPTRITREEAAVILLIPPVSIRNFERRGLLIPYPDRSNRVRYDRAQVETLAERLKKERQMGKLDSGVISVVFARFDAGATEAEVCVATELSTAQVAELHLQWAIKRAKEKPAPTLQELLTAELEQEKQEREKQERAKRFEENREAQKRFYEATLAAVRPAEAEPEAEESEYAKHQRERRERYRLLRQAALSGRKK